MSDNLILTKLLQQLWPKNKAKGLLAQAVFDNEVETGLFGNEAVDKILQGCWLLAPKETDFYKFRFSFFIHPVLLKEEPHKSLKDILGDKYRPFHAIAEFMNNAGVGIIYAFPATKTGKLSVKEIRAKNFESLNWYFFGFSNGEFKQENPIEFFGKWQGNRGRPSSGTPWDAGVRERISELKEEVLTNLLLNELFYAGFVKGTLKKPVNDPYDVDSFMLSISQQHILPMEIKEKFKGNSAGEDFFGIDAGRIMMLLRLCLPNDANAMYLIRELDERGNFLGWKYITLSDIIMTSSWNLQAGGPGMGGQSTQTIRLPYKYFKTFTKETMTEDYLKKIGNMPKDIKLLARNFGAEIESRFQ